MPLEKLRLDDVEYTPEELLDKLLQREPGEIWTYELVSAMLAQHQERGERISTTTLTTSCLRSESLQRLFPYTKEVAQMYPAYRGSAWHAELEQHAAPDTIAEARFHIDLPGLGLFSGSPDLLDVGRGILWDYKGLALDTPIPTPTGWTTMGELQAGDTVYGSDGKPCTVVTKFDRGMQPSYEIAFRGGETIVADHEHRWVVNGNIVTTKQLASTLGPKRIELAQPVAGDTADLPLNPYLLGVWLGDGTAGNGMVSGSLNSPVWAQLEARGFELGPLNGSNSRTVYGIRGTLAKLDLLHNKHVPAEYLRAAPDQRLDLLRGLMDSDGTWNTGREQAVFTNTNPLLVEAVEELVASLGWRSYTYWGWASGFGVEAWSAMVHFRSTENPFEAKLGWVPPGAGSTSKHHYITSVLPTPGRVHTACIEVDSPDHTYLCGRDFVPTHNTTKEVPRFDRAWGSAIEQMQINRWLVDHATAVEYNGQWIGDFDLALQLGKAHVPQSVNMTPEDFRPFDWQHLILVYLDNNGPKPIRTWKSIQVPTKVEGKTKPARVDDIWDDERVEKLIEERYSAAHDALVGRNIPAIPGPDWANGKAPLCSWCAQKSMCIDMQHEGK